MVTRSRRADKQRIMLDRLTPVEFIQQTPTGKTQPAFILCEDHIGEEVEVIIKVSGSSERGVSGLAMEALAACVVADLGVGVPRPFVVEMNPDWIAAVEIANPAWAARANASCPAAFGSRRLHDGFTTWVEGSPLLGGALTSAASILLFDAIAKNADRRPENPNCLRFGDELRVIDHELCFPEFLIGLGDAWTVGGLQALSTHGWHIFRDALHKKDIVWDPIVAAWRGLSDDLLGDYLSAIPAEWTTALPTIGAAIERIKLARDNIDDCVAEMQRVLKC